MTRDVRSSSRVRDDDPSFVFIERNRENLLSFYSRRRRVNSKCVTDNISEGIMCGCSDLRVKSRLLGRMKERGLNKNFPKMVTIFITMWMLLQGGRSTSAAFTTGN